MPPRLFAPRYWPTWAALGILRALSVLPFSWLVMLGRALGAIVRRLPVGFIKTARRNMEIHTFRFWRSIGV